MNSEFPQNYREAMEVKLTAFLLGELPADEIAEVSKAMERDPDLVALYEQLKVTIQLVRESASSPAAETAAPVAPLKLSEERREKLLAQFKTVAPKEFAKPRRVTDWLVPLTAAAAVVIILAALVLPALRSPKTRGMRGTRLDNPGVYRMAQSTDGRASVNNSSTEPSPTAPQTPTLLPSISSAREPKTPPSTTIALENKSIPNNVNIVLPKQAAVKEEDVPVQYAASRDISSALVELTNALPAGQLAYGGIVQSVTNFAVNSDSYSLQTQYHRLSQQATEPQQGELALNYTNNAGEARGKLYDEVPATGILSKRESQTTFVDGQIYSGTTREDLGGLRYLSTNGVISQSIEDQTVTGPLAGKGSIDTDTLTVVPKTEIVLPPEQPPTVLAYNTPAPMLAGGGPGAEPPAEGKKFEMPIVAAATAFASGATVEPKSAGENSNDNRALGYEWYLGNKLKPNSTIVASGGTASSVGPTNWFNGNGATVRGFYDDNAALGLNQTVRASAGAATAQNASILETRTFKVDPNTFYEKLQAAPAEKPQVAGALPKINAQTNRGLRYVTGLDTEADIQIAAVSFLRTNGVNLGSNDSFFFNDREGTITARATPEDLDKIEAVTGKLNAQAEREPQKDAASAKSADYFAAEKELENEKHWQQILSMKTGQEEVDKELPRATMVTILDPATPTAAEKPGLGEKIREAFSGKVERSARIQVETEHPDVAGATVANSYDPYFLLTEFETIRSDAVLKQVVENLKLDGGDKSKTEGAVQQLKKSLDVHPVKNSKLIEIGVRSEKAEDAARIANAVATAYRQYRLDEYEELKDHGIKSLKQQLAEQDQKVKLAQAKVDELRKDLGITDATANTFALSEQEKANYNRQSALLAKLKSMDHNALRKALPIAVTDTQLNELLSELDFAEQNLIKLKGDYAPNHPKYKKAKESVDDLNQKVDDRVEGIMAGLQAKVDATKASLDAAKKEAEQTQQNDTALPKPALPPPAPQPEVLTRENAFSTFSLNVSDVSFKLAAASLEKGQMPEPASIRSEEFINAFDYRDPDAAPGVPIAFASERAAYPFAHNRELLRFSLKTAAAGRQAGRPLNIVLLLDNSGSMERADRVSIIREALRVLAAQLQPSDTFSIVTFARTARLRVDGVPGSQAAAAAEEIAKLTPEGGTNLGDALDVAYETARHHYLANGDNRVVLLTDGAANLGDVQPDTLQQKVEAQRQQGIALDCFGIGWEGYNDDLLEVLTRHGDGRYGFINTPAEASTEFVSQIVGALHVAAADVKVQVEFNPKRVTSYRQIGYAKHQLTKEQFRDNTVDAAEIAAQEAGNALYTIETNPQGEGSIATVRVRYKVPGTSEYREQAWDVPYTGSAVALEQASPAMRLAATASAFSEWLATSPFAAEVSPDELLKYLNGLPRVYGADQRPAKLEWMIRQAKSISGK